ncbi:spastin-like [Toxorhynchites rutilus septentrionalis]|uniref:spastin-like n=1 Tax=Toxorhynchites rutilus septentrionalis TaxID=329112 RepID=UPI002479280A|nr:spastin-like [Toxorhynchites rutilus septentrionalis]XP_055616912.1 spastin-like [Toxorhynchites rutilus septentrionalis]
MAAANNMRNIVSNEILVKENNVQWDDVIGNAAAKDALRKTIVLPVEQGRHFPVESVLLFGAPGTGKTLLVRALASQCSAFFFQLSTSMLTSKYSGYKIHLLKTLFDMAKEQPSIVFLDDIEMISTCEHDNDVVISQIQLEIIRQMHQIARDSAAHVAIIAATNRPREVDSDILELFTARIHIQFLNIEERMELFKKLLEQHGCNVLTENEVKEIANLTTDYTGSDLALVVRIASIEPIRDLLNTGNWEENTSRLRSIQTRDFYAALNETKPSVPPDEIKSFYTFSEHCCGDG